MANTYLTRTPASASNRQTWTWSAWVKRSKLNSAQNLWGVFVHDNDNMNLNFNSGNVLEFKFYNGTVYKIQTNRVFRDTSAWYHIVCVADTTNATSGDRFRLYVNGQRETSFSVDSQPTQNLSMSVNQAQPFDIGRYNGANYFDGSISHINFIDGTAYDATAFGETDATTGEWKGKTSPSVTYGTNGFFILKDGNGITDQSGEGNDFTLGGGTLTDLKDNPDNVFATFNGAFNLSDIVLLRGNASATNSGANWKYVPTTLGASSGKFYAEYLCGGSANTFMHGVVDMEYAVSQDQNSYTQLGNGVGGMGYYSASGESYTTGTATSYGDSYAVGDYIGIALDMDNNKVYFSKNGVWQNSGDPTSGATGTGALALPTTGTYAFGTSVKDSSKTDANFGNGYFGTTPVTTNSGNGYAGAEGSSKFNYTVPTGYSALSTKGLNE